MKKNYILTLLITLITAASFGQVILAEDFSYPDGSLVPNGGWAREGGTAGDFQVTSGMAVVQHGTPSEDVKKAFSSVAGDVYAGFDFSVDDLGAVYSGSDNEYFAHFDFKARVDIQAPTGSGDYTVGIASNNSTAEATWATDLTFGTTYRAIVKFDQVTGTAQLWINPANSSDTSISGSGAGAFTISEFELRQSDSSENETVRVDNLMIGQTFDDVLVFAIPSEPTLTIDSPLNGSVLTGVTMATVSISTSNFTVGNVGGSGVDGHINWTIQENSAAAVTQPMKYDVADEMISVTPGNSYTVYMELVDDSDTPISPAVNATTTFTVEFPCDLQLNTITTTCDATTSGVDTYTATIDFTGGNTSTYTLAVDTGDISGANPSSVATGTITISNIPEGTDITFTADGDTADSSCTLTRNISSPVCIEFPVYEAFDYTAATDLIASPDWENNSTGSDEIQVVTGTITNPYNAGEFPDPVGNMVNFAGTGSDSYIQFNGATSGTIFASFLYTPTDMSTVTNTNGAYWAGLTTTTGSFVARLWVKPDATDGTMYNVGVSFTSSNSDIVYDTTAYTAGDIMFMVIGYDLDNDLVSVWVNPAAADLETASAPTATFTKGSATASSIGRFFLRQDSNTETANTNFDELRIGNTWAQVTPKTATASVEKNSIAGFTAYPNPVKNSLTVATSSSEEKEVIIYNVLGKQVFATKFTGTQKPIDISNMNAGIYIIKVIENGKTATKKLIVE